MRSALQMLGGVAVAGVVATGGTALTGAGVAWTGGITQTGFVGGTVSQTVQGATITSVSYLYGAQTAGDVTGVTVAFDDAYSNGKTLALVPSGGSAEGGFTSFVCSGAIASAAKTCTANLGSYRGMTALAITVS
jgi:hypothetical protein